MQAINTIVLWIIAVFAVLGIIERIVREWAPDLELPLIAGWGAEMEEGFNAMGPLALAMVGIIALAPVLSQILVPIVGPIYTALLSKPAMFAGTLLAIDMGGTPMGLAIAEATGDPEWVGYYGGLILGSMFGVNLVFNIPVGLGIIEAADRRYLALGTLAGIVMTPIGVLVSGLVAGYGQYGVFTLILYLIPVAIVAILIAVGLAVAREAMITGFMYFGHFITSLILVGLGAAIFEAQTGVVIIPGMASIFSWCDGTEHVMEGLEVIGAIAIALAGAYPLVKFLTTVLGGPLGAMGKSLGMTDIGAAGLVATLANNIPMFGIFKDMTPRGKTLNAAFQVAAAFTFADHLGFTAANAPHLIAAVIIGKLVGGVLGLVVGMFVAPKEGAEA
jgi:ethanolamine transporter